MGRRRHRLLHHLLHRRLRQPRLAPAPGTIAQPVQPVQRKPPDPAVHRDAGDPQLLGDALLGQTLRTQHDDLRSPTIPHRYRRRASPAAQLLGFFRSQLDRLTRHNQIPPIGTPIYHQHQLL
jgi:hypothetical protein